MGQFIPAWVRSAGDAQGQCTKICADLEGLECQNELIQMITDCSGGIAKARKGLTALLGSGNAPTPNDVRVILQEVPAVFWRLIYTAFVILLKSPSKYLEIAGSEIRRRVQEAHQDWSTVVTWSQAERCVVSPKDQCREAQRFAKKGEASKEEEEGQEGRR